MSGVVELILKSHTAVDVRVTVEGYHNRSFHASVPMILCSHTLAWNIMVHQMNFDEVDGEVQVIVIA